jgi:uncharacterized membrane protein YeaQ/YmgE (transglycosylase-associated protein family)
MIPNVYGEMFELLPIYAAAVLLGLVSGVVAVHLLTTRKGQLSLRAIMGIVVLTALVSSLIAAKPEFWQATAAFWAMAAAIMGVVDLAVVGLVDPWRATRRFSERSGRRLLAWTPPGIVGAIAGTLAALKVSFDVPLHTEDLPSFAAYLVGAVLALAVVDLAARLAAIRWSRRRSGRMTGQQSVRRTAASGETGSVGQAD